MIDYIDYDASMDERIAAFQVWRTYGVIPEDVQYNFKNDGEMWYQSTHYAYGHPPSLNSAYRIDPQVVDAYTLPEKFIGVPDKFVGLPAETVTELTKAPEITSERKYADWDKLRMLADWLDIRDVLTGTEGHDVQDDLRRIADNLEAAYETRPVT